MEQTCHVFSGHSKNEAYHIEEDHIDLQCTIEQYENFLLPALNEKFRPESQSDVGDDSECCDKFLNQILPYLVEVLVTCGIKLVRDFPNHVMTRILVETIPGYLDWARRAREQARNQYNLRERDQMEPLNHAAATALETCHRRLDQLVTHTTI